MNRKCEHENHEGPCEGELTVRHAMTQYHFSQEDRESGKEDPNRDFLSCDYHYSLYRDHWSEMWGEYYSSIGFPGYSPYSHNESYISPHSVMDEFIDFISESE